VLVDPLSRWPRWSSGRPCWLAGWLAGWRCGGFIGVVLEEGGMVRLRLVSRRLSVLGRMKVVRWCCEEELLVELVTGKC